MICSSSRCFSGLQDTLIQLIIPRRCEDYLLTISSYFLFISVFKHHQMMRIKVEIGL